MTVTSKNKKFYIRGKIKRDDGTYYNYYQLAKNCRTKKEAKAYEEEFLKQYQGIRISKTQITFKEAFEEFIVQHKDVKNSTLISKRELMRKVFPYIGDKKINLITSAVLQKMIDDLEQKGFSVEYVKRIYYNVNQVFNYLVRTSKLQQNPMLRVTRHTKKDEIKSDIEFWEPDQFKTFISYVNEIRWNVIFNFLYFTGMRRGEMAALHWNDIDMNSGLIRINKTMSFKERPPKETTPKTKNSTRNIRMPKILFNIMIDYKETCKKYYGFTEDFYVFGADRPVDPETLRRKLDHYILLANDDLAKQDKKLLPKIHIHSFRHSHASYLINQKMYDYDIARRLGDTVETVRNVYAHWFENAEDEIMAAFDRF